MAKQRINPETGRIEGGFYNGLTPSEADELYQGLMSDYKEKAKQRQVDYVKERTQKGINKAGEVLQTVADFTPLGVVKNVVEGIDAGNKGEYGRAVENAAYAGLWALPAVGKYTLKGFKKLIPRKAVPAIDDTSNIITHINKGVEPGEKLAKQTSSLRKELSQVYDDPRFTQRVKKMFIDDPEKVDLILDRADKIANKNYIDVIKGVNPPDNRLGAFYMPKTIESFLMKSPPLKAVLEAEKIPESRGFVKIFRSDPKKLFSDKSILLHELEGHGLTLAEKLLPKEFVNTFNKLADKAASGKFNRDSKFMKYLFKPTEARARMSQMRDLRKRLTGKNWWDTFTVDDYNKIKESGREISPEFFEFLDSDVNNKAEFLRWMNKMFAPAGATAVGGAGVAMKEKMGGVIYKRGGRLLNKKLLKK